MNFRQHDYVIGEHFASALINDDYSGLNDHEERLLNAFIDNAFNDHGLGHWDTYPLIDAHFRRCEVTGLHNNCIDVVRYTEIKKG